MWSRVAACVRLRDLALTLAKTDKVFRSFRLIKKWSSIGTLLGVHHSDQWQRTFLKNFHEDIFIESQHLLNFKLIRAVIGTTRPTDTRFKGARYIELKSLSFPDTVVFLHNGIKQPVSD